MADDNEVLERIEARLAAIEERQRRQRPVTAAQEAAEAREMMRAGYAQAAAEREAAAGGES